MVTGRNGFASDEKDEEEEERTAYLDGTVAKNPSSSKQETIVIDEDVDVRPNDHKVLEILREDSSSYTFRGLMRRLGMHQETLSRSLHRLDELGLIEKSSSGYKLSKKAGFLSKGSVVRAEIALTPLLQTYIPPNVDLGSIVASLVGRWFKNLRWLGTAGDEAGQTLQWASEDGTFRLNLRIVGHHIIIETDASTEKDKVEAMVCTYRIFRHLSALYSNNNHNSRVLAYAFSSGTSNNNLAN